MRTVFLISIYISFAACKSQNISSQETSILNYELNEELNNMLQSTYSPDLSEFNTQTASTWRLKKDSIYHANKFKLVEIFKEYGYPGYDLVGKQGEAQCWVMVMHCNFDPDFQREVLSKLEEQVKIGNANAIHFGKLTDRIKVNIGEKQVYGTEATVNQETGQIIPQPLADSINVNTRRKQIGLEPIEEYYGKVNKAFSGFSSIENFSYERVDTIHNLTPFKLDYYDSEK